MIEPSRIRMTGPLKPHAKHVWSRLLAQDYTALSSCNLLRLMAHLSRWLEGTCLQAHELTNARIEEFLGERRRSGYTNHLSRRGLKPILEHLETVGVVLQSEHAKPVANEQDRLLNDYGQYLVQERAVVPMTVRHYESIVSLRQACLTFGDRNCYL